MAVSKRRSYSDLDKARVFAELEVNEGNVKRTARNLAMPISTVRHFKQQWEANGVPQDVIEAVPVAIGEFVDNAERVRDKLLIALEGAVDSGRLKPSEMVTALGVLTDKIRAMRGLDAKRVEHSIALPDANEMRALFAGVIGEVVGAAQTRTDELVAADIIEGSWEPAARPALPKPTEAN